MIIDLRTGESEYIKLGSAPTYIIHEGKVITISNMNIPIGIADMPDYLPITRKLVNDDLVIQISDGVVADNIDMTNNYFTNYLKNIDVNKSPKIISDELYKLVLRENKNVLKDDVTIIVTKLKKI